MDIQFFLLATIAVLYAGISKGGFGSGAAFLAAPLMALVVEPDYAVGLMLPLLMLMDATALRPFWGKWDGGSVKRLILGSLPGVALGALLFRYAEPDVLRVILGLVSLSFVGYQLSRKFSLLPKRPVVFRPWVGYLTGAAAGFTSYVSHAGGPLVAIYMLAQNVGKTTYQSTSVIVFWAINLFKALPYALLGLFTADTLLVDIILAPVAVVGVFIGVKAHHFLPEHIFFNVTYVLLVCTGLKLIYDGVL
ncbi:MAG: sulfite exporter TauE/SafE family protein [Pseudoruegeria sp.]